MVRLISSGIYPAVSTSVGTVPTMKNVKLVFPLGRIGCDFGGLERVEDMTAQLQGIVDGLHVGPEGSKLVVAET